MIQQWLLPPKPELTGLVREPFINQRRQMKRIAFGATQEEVRAIAEAKADAKRRMLNALQAGQQRVRERIAAECRVRGETPEERKARMIREKYARKKKAQPRNRDELIALKVSRDIGAGKVSVS